MQVLQKSDSVLVVPHDTVEQLEVALNQREVVFAQLILRRGNAIQAPAQIACCAFEADVTRGPSPGLARELAQRSSSSALESTFSSKSSGLCASGRGRGEEEGGGASSGREGANARERTQVRYQTAEVTPP